MATNLILLKCSNCKKYLSYPPIKINTKSENVCGRCNIDGIYCERNEAYEEMVKSLLFPCAYDKEGCKVELKIQDMAEHESLCGYRKCKCFEILPKIKCNWNGYYKDLVSHCLQVHPSVFSEYPFEGYVDVKMEEWQYLIMKMSDVAFILKYLVTKNKIQHAVQILMRNSDLKVEEYSLKIAPEEAQDVGCKFFYQIKSLNDINECSIDKIQYVMEKEKNLKFNFLLTLKEVTMKNTILVPIKETALTTTRAYDKLQMLKKLKDIVRKSTACRKYQEAQLICQNAINILKEISACDDSDEIIELSIIRLNIRKEMYDKCVIDTLNELSSFHKTRCDFPAAENCYREALLISKKHPENVLQIAVSSENLGSLLMNVDRYDEAINLFQRSSAIREKIGIEDVEFATVLIKLGDTYHKLKRYHDAKIHLLKAKTVYEKAFGVKHKMVISFETYKGSLGAGFNITEQNEPATKKAKH